MLNCAMPSNALAPMAASIHNLKMALKSEFVEFTTVDDPDYLPTTGIYASKCGTGGKCDGGKCAPCGGKCATKCACCQTPPQC